jgi:hypothetical protein
MTSSLLNVPSSLCPRFVTAYELDNPTALRCFNLSPMGRIPERTILEEDLE